MTWLDAAGKWQLRTTPDGRTCHALHGAGTPGKPAVVLIHGVGMSQQVWVPQVEGLLGQRSVLTYDMLGHGGSAMPPQGATLRDYAAQLAQLLDHLGLDRVALAGHSMGSLVALEFALAHPGRVDRLVMLNAVHRRDAAQRDAVQQRARLLHEHGGQTLLAPTLQRWFGAPVPDALQTAADLTRTLLERIDPQGYAISYDAFAHGDAVHAARLPELAMPALFATGALDANSSPAMSQALAAAAPQGHCVILPSARHMMTLTHATEVNALLNGFL